MANTTSILRDASAFGGLSPTQLRAKEDEYVQQRNAAMAPYEQTLQKNAEVRQKILSTPTERPAKPYLQALPQAPVQQFRNPAEAMMSGGPILAALGSLFTRRPAVAMMNSFANGMKAFHAGDQTRMEQERKNWKDALDQTLAQNSAEMQAYNVALQDVNFSMAERQAQLTAIAAENQDQQMLASLRTGSLDSAYKLLIGRQESANALVELKYKADMQAAQLAEERRHNLATEAAKSGGGLGGIDINNDWDAGQALLALEQAGAVNSSQYAAIYNRLAQPKSTYDSTTNQMITQTPDMSAYKRPGAQSNGNAGFFPAGEASSSPSFAAAASNQNSVKPSMDQLAARADQRLQSSPSQAAVNTPNQNVVSANGLTVTQMGAPRISDTEKKDLTSARTEALALVKSLQDYAKEYADAGTWERIKTGGGASTQLSNKYNIAAMLAKGEALFKLGVLAGPDMDIVRGVLTDPSTFASAFTTAAGAQNQVNSLVDNIAFKLNTYESLLNQKPTIFPGFGASNQSSLGVVSPASDGGRSFVPSNNISADDGWN